MTDIHTHILYSFDDGADNIDISIDMLEEQRRQSIDTVILTPHYDPHEAALDSFCEIRQNRLNNLLKYTDIKLIAASETYFSNALLHMTTILPLCIGNSRDILIELPFGCRLDKVLLMQLENLIGKYCVRPIIAHVERTRILHQIGGLDKLHDIGCLVQVNCEFAQRNIKSVTKLIKLGRIDYLASDCHNMDSRPPCLGDTLHMLDTEAAEILKENIDNLIINKR